MPIEIPTKFTVPESKDERIPSVASPFGPGFASIIRNSFFLFSGQGIQFGVRFIYAIILARFLGPYEYGLFTYGMSLYLAILPLTRLGLEQVMMREIGRNRAHGRRMLRYALPIRRSCACFITGVFIVAVILLESNTQMRWLLLSFSVALLGRSLAMWNTALFTAYEVNKYSLRLQSIFRPLEVVLGLCALVIWKTPLSVVLVHALTWWMEVLFGTILARKVISLPSGQWDLSASKELLPPAILLGVILALSSWMMQGPLVIFKHIEKSGASIGDLALAMQMFSILSQFPIIISNAAFPVLSRTVARADGKELFFASTIMRYTFLIGGITALVGMTLGPFFVVKVFSVQYAGAGPLIGPVLWMLIPWTLLNVLRTVQLAKGHNVSSMLFMLIGVAIFVIASRPAILIWGMKGPIAAASFGMIVTSLCFMKAVSSHGNLNIVFSALKPLGVVIISFSTCILLKQTGQFYALFGSLAAMALGWLFLGCMTNYEKMILLSKT